MKLVVASDLHGYLFEVPEGDVLILCGDIVPLSCQSNMIKSGYWFRDKFLPWAMAAPVDKVLFIGGNHDFYLEKGNWQYSNDKVVYLHCGEKYNYKDKTFYGFPFIRQFGRWAFPDVNKTIYEKMEEADVLFCHDTPSIIPGTFTELQRVRYGCVPGNERLAEQMYKYKYCFCGHWHDANHSCVEKDGCKIYNVSLLNDNYEPVYEPLILDI